MSQLTRSPKKLAPEIYRRRRIAAFIVLAVVVALIWTGVNALSSWLTSSAPEQEIELPEGMAESSVVVEPGQPCPAGTVVVEAQVGDSSGTNNLTFGPADTPHIWFTLTNTNSVDCTFNAGAKVQYFTILSGNEQIWSSKQCDRSALEDSQILLAAATTISSPPLPWEKVFSSATGCGVDQAPVITGGASYHLRVEVNGELSANKQQFVLN
jgi:hypothetical protein